MGSRGSRSPTSRQPTTTSSGKDALSESWFATGESDLAGIHIYDPDETLTNLLGPEATPVDLALLVGAPKGSEVSLSSQGSHHMSIVVTHPDYPEFVMDRTLYSTGRKLELSMEEFHRGGAPQGIGTRTLATTVIRGRQLGVSKLTVYAAGNKGHPVYNGYSTWAKLGYKLNIDPSLSRAAVRAGFKPVKTTHDLLRQKGGIAWWEEHGRGSSGSFDLNPRSVSSRILSDYMKTKGISV